jgi:hypothetical protein
MKLKRTILLLVTIFCAVMPVSLYAQKIKVAISPEVLFPFSSLYTVSAAGALTAELPVKDKFGLTLETGAAVSIVVNDYKRNISFFSLKGGGKYYLTRQLFLNFNAGVALGFSTYGNHFIIGGGAGYQLTDHFNVSLRAEEAGVSYLALRTGFSF